MGRVGGPWSARAIVRKATPFTAWRELPAPAQPVRERCLDFGVRAQVLGADGAADRRGAARPVLPGVRGHQLRDRGKVPPAWLAPAGLHGRVSRVRLARQVQGLQPNTSYQFRVYARNVIGTSHSSEPAEIVTAPHVPIQPSPPELASVTQTSLGLRWAWPADNGSPVRSAAMPCRAVPCRAMPCHAMLWQPCHAMPCHANGMVWHSMALPGNAISIPCHAIPAALCHIRS